MFRQVPKKKKKKTFGDSQVLTDDVEEKTLAKDFFLSLNQI